MDSPENIDQVVEAFLNMVDVAEISELDDEKLYKIIMLAYAQGEGKSANTNER